MMRKPLLVAALVLLVSTPALAQPKSGTQPAQPAKGGAQPAQPARPQPKPPEPPKELPGPKDAVTVKAAKELKWAPAPPAFPPGAEIALVSGDMTAEGPFVVRLRFPAKYKIPNHWHPAHEHVTVLEGAFWLGHGETWDDKGLVEVKAGGFAMMPPKHGHFVQIKKKTVIQVHGWGPWGITYYNPSDDPRNKTATTTAPTTPAATPPAKTPTLK